jgi:hypothetical protein
MIYHLFPRSSFDSANLKAVGNLYITAEKEMKPIEWMETNVIAGLI